MGFPKEVISVILGPDTLIQIVQITQGAPRAGDLYPPPTFKTKLNQNFAIIPIATFEQKSEISICTLQSWIKFYINYCYNYNMLTPNHIVRWTKTNLLPFSLQCILENGLTWPPYLGRIILTLLYSYWGLISIDLRLRQKIIFFFFIYF